MAKRYAQFSLSLKFSDNADHDPKLDSYPHEGSLRLDFNLDGLIPDKKLRFNVQTGASTFDLSAYENVYAALIVNHDETNYFDVVTRNAAGGANDQTVRVYAKGSADGPNWTFLTNLTIANDIVATANSGDCEADVIILGKRS